MFGDKWKEGSSKINGNVITVKMLILSQSRERFFPTPSAHPNSCECVE